MPGTLGYVTFVLIVKINVWKQLYPTKRGTKYTTDFWTRLHYGTVDCIILFNSGKGFRKVNMDLVYTFLHTVQTYIHTYIRDYTQTCIHRSSTDTYRYLQKYTYTVHTYIRDKTHTIHLRVIIYTCIHTHIHISITTYTHRYKYTYIQ